MTKIGICFPERDYKRLEENEFIEQIKKLKEGGLYSFDLYTELILRNKPNKFLLTTLFEEDIKITFHHNGVLYTGNEKEDIKKIKKDLKELRKIMKANKHNYETTIVFHIPNYEDNKYAHIKKMIKYFKEISKIGEKNNFKILIETLSNNHPKGNHVGNDFSEIILFINNIPSKNFGICWDVGHTRLNHIEDHENIFIPEKLKEKIMFTHIHSFYKKDEKIVEHMPITNLELQDDEIDFLKESNYNGVYSLEYQMDGIKENVNIYIDNIKKLTEYIEKR